MLKIMTLNINYYVDKHGAWPERRERIARAIHATQPDVIALQAVKQDPHLYDGVDQATQLATLAPDYTYTLYQPAATKEDGGAEGSAIISRVPIEDSVIRPLTLLPGLDDTNSRVVVGARLALRSEIFYLFNAHFSWVDQQAVLNVEETLDLLDGYRSPALLVGDMNQSADAPALAGLAAAGWTDIWPALCPDDKGYSFEAPTPNLRIDYAWANQPLRPLVRSIQTVADTRDTAGAEVSDHFGLLVTIDLEV